MLAEEPDETTRTPEVEGGDAPESTETAGTPPEEGRDAPEGSTDYKSLSIANKATIEELRAENERLRREREAGSLPAAGSDDTGRESEARYEQINAGLRRAAEAGDFAAAAVLELREENQRLRGDVGDALVLADIPKERRAEVYAGYRKSGLPNLAQYIDQQQRRETQSEIERLRTENAALKSGKPPKLPADERNDREDAVRTSGRDLSTPTHKARAVDRETFKAEIERLHEAGDHKAARQKQADLREGKIVYKR